MNDLRGHLADLRARETEREGERIAANTNVEVSSLADLARLRHREAEQARAADLAAQRERREALRLEYLRHLTQRGLRDLPGLLAKEWDLPVEHEFIQSLSWELVTDSFDDATFTEDSEGAISVEAGYGKRLEEVFETVIDGRRVQAQLFRSGGDTPPTLVLQGVAGPSSRGLRGLTGLGEFLDDPETKAGPSPE